jgi:hypothetical protein
MEVVSNFQVITQAPVDCCGLEKSKRNSSEDFQLQNSRDQVIKFKGLSNDYFALSMSRKDSAGIILYYIGILAIF